VQNAARPPQITWIGIWSGPILFAVVTISLLVWQYFRRQTFMVRGIEIIACVCGLAPSHCNSANTALITSQQPSASFTRYPEVSVAFAPERGYRSKNGFRDKVQIDIPFEIKGRNRDLLNCELAAIRVAPAQGKIWTAGWSWYIHVMSGGGDWIELNLDRRTFEQLDRGPVNVRAVFGLVVYEPRKTVRLRLGEWTALPEFGRIETTQTEGSALLLLRVPFMEPSRQLRYVVRDSNSTELYQGGWYGSYPPLHDPHQCRGLLFALSDAIDAL
jgi:hypothetical protein